MANEQELASFLIEVLTALGQMDHISSRHTHEGECEKCKTPYKKTQVIAHNGLMSMPVKTRAELTTRGYSLIKYNPDTGKHELL